MLHVMDQDLMVLVSDGILHVLVLGMRSPSNSELSFSACGTGDLRVAIRIQTADRECATVAIPNKWIFKILFYSHLMATH